MQNETKVYSNNDCLKQALDKLDVRAVARDNGLALVDKKGREVRPGQRCMSPFRGDGKSPGLVLVADKTRTRIVGTYDASTGEKLGLYAFAERATRKTGKELVEYLCRLANVPMDTLQPETEEERRKRHKLAEKRKAAAEAQRLLGMLNEQPEPYLPIGWPDCVRLAWQRGTKGADTLCTDTDSERGWPLGWTKRLLDAGCVSFPVLPWGRDRAIAFAVSAPPVGDRDAVIVGYHQRFLVKEENGKVRKSWVYCPYQPVSKLGRIWTDYQAAMAKAQRDTLALPFYLGNPNAARWIVTEGQWDAVTLYGLLGGFDKPINVCVIGLRGVSSIGLLLRVWEPILRAKTSVERPKVYFFRDADGAGENLCEAKQGEPMKLADRWQRLFGLSFNLRIFCPEVGKDANDWMKSGQLTAKTLEKMLG